MVRPCPCVWACTTRVQAGSVSPPQGRIGQSTPEQGLSVRPRAGFVSPPQSRVCQSAPEQGLSVRPRAGSGSQPWGGVNQSAGCLVGLQGRQWLPIRAVLEDGRCWGSTLEVRVSLSASATVSLSVSLSVRL